MFLHPIVLSQAHSCLELWSTLNLKLDRWFQFFPPIPFSLSPLCWLTLPSYNQINLTETNTTLPVLSGSKGHSTSPIYIEVGLQPKLQVTWGVHCLRDSVTYILQSFNLLLMQLLD